MNIYDVKRMQAAVSRTVDVHLPCLNARMHHTHAVADLKFDPDNMPDLDKL